MTVEGLSKLFTFCLAAAGLAAAAFSGAVLPGPAAAFSAVLLAAIFVDPRALRRRCPRRLPETVILACLPLLALDYFLFARPLLVCAMHLLLAVSAVKLPLRDTARDHLVLYLVSFAQLLAAATMPPDLPFAGLFLFWLASAAGAFLLFELRKSLARAEASAHVRPLVSGAGPRVAALLWLSLGTAAAVLLAAAPLFLLLPRVPAPAQARQSGVPQPISGFSERVRLGEIGEIKTSAAVVMKVRLSEPPARLPAGLKWRGIALERFDGRSWSRGRNDRRELEAQGEYYKLQDFALGPALLTQTFLQEALATDALFAAHSVLAFSADLGSLRRDAADNFYTERPAAGKLRYSAVSDLTRPDPALIPSWAGEVPPSVRERCLQLPEGDPFVAEVARALTRRIPHPYFKAAAIERHLKTKYPYSLRMVEVPPEGDPVAAFLFDTRAGHCEYFASAMAVMLRHIGIPSRLVNGFHAGEYNRLADAWTVRRYHAHSWVEAYFPPYGWIEFDPTPAEPAQPLPALAGMIRGFGEAVDVWWSEDIVHYDFWKQYRMVAAARAGLSGAGRSARAAWTEVSPRAAEAALLAALLAAFVLLWKMRRPLWVRRAVRAARAVLPQGPKAAISGIYAEALARLRAEGRARRTSETPLEFAASLAGHPCAEAFGELTELYNRVRFGREGSPRDLEHARRLLRSLQAGQKKQDAE